MDKSVSTRAKELRNRVLEMGIPCAVSFPPFAVEHLKPVVCILTFQDAVDTIRRSPLDDVPVFACGHGFVNSLMHAELFPDIPAMLSRMEEYLFGVLHTEKTWFAASEGYVMPSGFIITERQIYYHAFSLDLTRQERWILQLILCAPEQRHSYRRIEAYCFSYPYADFISDIANTITVQISTINKKAVQACGRKILQYKGGGLVPGYILHVRKPVKKTKK